MSASSIARAAADAQLQSRIIAMANKEIIYNEELADTWFGRQIQSGLGSYNALYWPVAVETEAAYETAINSGRGAPGFDTDIITDAAITSAITANWPENPNPLPPVINPGSVPPPASDPKKAVATTTKKT